MHLPGRRLRVVRQFHAWPWFYPQFLCSARILSVAPTNVWNIGFRKERGGIVVAPVVARLAAVVDELHNSSDDLPAQAMLEQIRELRRELDRLESVYTRKVAAAHRAGAAGAAGYATTKAFLQHACHVASGAARARIDVGLQLADRPAVEAEFADGTISYAHVKAIIEALGPLPQAVQADAEPVLLEVARRHDPARVHQAARRLRHLVDPDGQASADERHYENRWVDLASSYQGIGLLRGALDAESAAVVRTALEALATPAGDIDPRTPAQRRADALVELARHVLDSGELPESGGERPHLVVAVDHASLIGASTAPAELGYSEPLSVDAARRIACDALVTRVVTGPPENPTDLPAGFAAVTGIDRRRANTAPSVESPPGYLDALPRHFLQALPPPLRGPSQILDVGRTARTATSAIRKALAMRDKGCVFPGCDRPPSRCEAHHVIHWVDGGMTAIHNMVLLCSFHHHFVHEYKWQIRVHHDGTVTVTPPPAEAA